MRLDEARRDYYRKLAKEQGYKSRAAYKLLDVNRRYGLIKEGDRVVDFGAAPGGWLQVASDLVGESGIVIGVDLDEVSLKLANVRLLKVDVFDREMVDALRERLPNGRADVMLSDLSPQVSGAWDLDHYRQAELVLRVAELMGPLLMKRGNAMLKIFDGERFREVRDTLVRLFNTVYTVKPEASRRQSSELYLACLGYNG